MVMMSNDNLKVQAVEKICRDNNAYLFSPEYDSEVTHVFNIVKFRYKAKRKSYWRIYTGKVKKKCFFFIDFSFL